MTFVGFKSSMFDKNSFLANSDPEPFFNENNQLQQNMAAPVWLHNANYIVKLLLSKKLCVYCVLRFPSNCQIKNRNPQN